MKKRVILAVVASAILLVLVGATATITTRQVPNGMYLVTRKKDKESLRYSVVLPEKWIEPSGLKVDITGWECYSRKTLFETADGSKLQIRLMPAHGPKEPTPPGAQPVSANGLAGFATFVETYQLDTVGKARLYGNRRELHIDLISPNGSISNEEFQSIIESFKQGDRRVAPVKAYHYSMAKIRKMGLRL